MLYVGLDVHLKRSSVCVLNENGKQVLAAMIRGRWNSVIEEVAETASCLRQAVDLGRTRPHGGRLQWPRTKQAKRHTSFGTVTISCNRSTVCVIVGTE